MTAIPTALRRWEPPVADAISTLDRTPPGPPADHPIIVEAELEPPIAHTLVHTIKCASMDNILCAPDPALNADLTYRDLPRLVDVRPTVTINAKRYSLEEIPDRPNGAIRDHRPEHIGLELHLQLNGNPYPGFGSLIAIETDLLLVSPQDTWIGDVRALVTPDTTLPALELVDILRAAYFDPGDSFEAGPWDRQLKQFTVHARHIAHRTLADDDTATRESLVDALKNDLLWLIPLGRRVEITIDERRRVDVRLATP